MPNTHVEREDQAPIDSEREAQIRTTYGEKPWADVMFALRLLDEARATEIARALTAYGDQRDCERLIAKALTLVPPGSRQWVEDELRGRKRVAGEIVP